MPTHDDSALSPVAPLPVMAPAPAPTAAAAVQDRVEFLMDGEKFFAEFKRELDRVRDAAKDSLTYVRLAFWKAEDMNFPAIPPATPASTLVTSLKTIVDAGHNVDVILWSANKKSKVFSKLAKQVAKVNRTLAKSLVRLGAGEGSGDVRVFLERYEGTIGSANHQKVAIFSVAGQRDVILGGVNLCNYYYDNDAHQLGTSGPDGDTPWHDTGILLQGPSTTDVEAEWMRRWNRAASMPGQLLSSVRAGRSRPDRAVAPGVDATVRRPRTYAPPANTDAQVAPSPNASVQIRVTRSEGSRRVRDLRDALIGLIQNAKHYIYFENVTLADPEIVRALYRRAVAYPALRIRVLTNDLLDLFGFMTRRSFLQIALRLPWEKIGYRRGKTPLELKKADLQAGSIQVFDSYDDSEGTGAMSMLKKKWLLDDALIAIGIDSKEVKIPLHAIEWIKTDFHFYTCWVRSQHFFKRPTIHSKLAVIDDQYVIVGSANWTYRSMQYDGEMSAIIDSPAVASATLTALLAHYQTGGGLTLDKSTDTFESVARNNFDFVKRNKRLPSGEKGAWVLPIMHEEPFDVPELKSGKGPDKHIRYATGVPPRDASPSYKWL